MSLVLSVCLKRIFQLFLPLTCIPLFPVLHVLKWRSRKQFPGAARKLGLKSSSGYGLSTYGGRFNGYDVEVTPDEGNFRLKLNHWKSVEINDQKPYHVCREDLCEIPLTHTLFNTIFRTRRVFPEDVPKFKAESQIVKAVVQFYSKRMWRIQLFRIDDSELACGLNYGQPFSAYIPATELESLLNELCILAKVVEAELTDKPIDH